MNFRTLILLVVLLNTVCSVFIRANNPVSNPWQVYGNFYEHSFTYLHNIPLNQRRVGLIYQHPDIRNYLVYNSISNFNLTINFPVSKKFNMEIQLPFNQTSYNEKYGSYTSEKSTTGYGNISFLLQVKPELTQNYITHFAFGVSFPVFTADFYSFNFRDYIPQNNYSFFGYYSFAEKLEHNFVIAIEAGPRIWIPSGNAPNTDAEIFLDYGTSAGILFDNFLFNAELIGVLNLSAAKEFELLKRNNIVSAGLGYRFNSFNIGMNYGYILKSALNKYMKGIFSAKIEIII